MHKVTAAYDSESGYTPGDAYDLYLDATGVIREWIFRKSGQAEPSRITTWENVQPIGGMRMALDFIGTDGFKLWFTDVSVK